MVARILHIPMSYLKNLSDLITACKCGYRINIVEYTRRAQAVYAKYNRSFKWHYMGPGLHKLLVHVPQLQELLDYPIAFSAEEAIESAHKMIRRLIRSNVFVGSPESVMEGVMRAMLIRSDPCIATLFQFPRTREEHRSVPQSVKRLIIEE